VQHLGGFFHQIKVRHPIGIKNSIKTVGNVPKIKQEQVGGVFVIGDFKL
jgi:hypothetical protein